MSHKEITAVSLRDMRNV